MDRLLAQQPVPDGTSTTQQLAGKKGFAAPQTSTPPAPSAAEAPSETIVPSKPSAATAPAEPDENATAGNTPAEGGKLAPKQPLDLTKNLAERQQPSSSNSRDRQTAQQFGLSQAGRAQRIQIPAEELSRWRNGESTDARQAAESSGETQTLQPAGESSRQNEHGDRIAQDLHLGAGVEQNDQPLPVDSSDAKSPELAKRAREKTPGDRPATAPEAAEEVANSKADSREAGAGAPSTSAPTAPPAAEEKLAEDATNTQPVPRPVREERQEAAAVRGQGGGGQRSNLESEELSQTVSLDEDPLVRVLFVVRGSRSNLVDSAKKPSATEAPEADASEAEQEAPAKKPE
jgi:hypothetical protein